MLLCKNRDGYETKTTQIVIVYSLKDYSISLIYLLLSTVTLVVLLFASVRTTLSLQGTRGEIVPTGQFLTNLNLFEFKCLAKTKTRFRLTLKHSTLNSVRIFDLLVIKMGIDEI